MSEKLVFFKNEEVPSYETTEFAERIKALRKRNKITQEKMSECTGVSMSTYGTYERSESLPNAETIQKMAKVFDVSADYILGLTNAEEPLDLELIIFSSKAVRDLKKIAEANSIKMTFEALIHQKDFMQLVTYMYTYLLLTTKIAKNSKKLLTEQNLYDKIYYADIEAKGDKEAPENPLQIFDYPDNKVEIAEIYRARLHGLLDIILKSMSKETFFSDEMEKKIQKATNTVQSQAMDKVLNFLFQGNDSEDN